MGFNYLPFEYQNVTDWPKSVTKKLIYYLVGRFQKFKACLPTLTFLTQIKTHFSSMHHLANINLNQIYNEMEICLKMKSWFGNRYRWARLCRIINRGFSLTDTACGECGSFTYSCVSLYSGLRYVDMFSRLLSILSIIYLNV